MCFAYMQCAFGDIKFVDIIKVTRMEYKMLCDIKTGGCGTTNFVHRVISRCPPIFTIGKFLRTMIVISYTRFIGYGYNKITLVFCSVRMGEG